MRAGLGCRGEGGLAGALRLGSCLQNQGGVGIETMVLGSLSDLEREEFRQFPHSLAEFWG